MSVQVRVHLLSNAEHVNFELGFAERVAATGVEEAQGGFEGVAGSCSVK